MTMLRRHIASRLVDMELYGLPDDYFEQYVGQIQAVTAADVQRVAKQYLVKTGRTVVITVPKSPPVKGEL